MYRTEAERNELRFLVHLLDLGWGKLDLTLGNILFGTAGTVYVMPNQDIQLGNARTGLLLAAGTYLLAYSLQDIYSGAWEHEQGVITANSETTATDLATGEKVNFLTAASALIAGLNGYLHYTDSGSAEKIRDSRMLLAGDGSGGKVYMTRDVYLSGQLAKEKLGIDPAKTVNAVVGFLAQNPVVGPQFAPKLGTNIPAGGLQYVGDSPCPIQPIFTVKLLN